MPTRIVVLFGICTLVLVGLSLGGCWWVGGGRSITGNLVGQVVDSSGTGIDNVSVALIDVSTGNVIKQQNARENGDHCYSSTR